MLPNDGCENRSEYVPKGQFHPTGPLHVKYTSESQPKVLRHVNSLSLAAEFRHHEYLFVLARFSDVEGHMGGRREDVLKTPCE